MSEPAIAAPEMTLPEMRDHLTERIAKVTEALNVATKERGRLALEVERGHASQETVSKLAAAEKRRVAFTAELERLRQAATELERQAEAKRAADKRAATLALLAEYEGHRDFVRDASRRLFEAIAELAPVVSEARDRAKAARALANELGLPVSGGGAFYPEFGATRSAFKAIMGDTGRIRDRVLSEGRQRVAADWRDSGDGERARELRASLGEPPA
jgi:small-conductance mechanosensitive channel